jgi:hypothetical protein
VTVLAFLEHEFPGMPGNERQDLVTKILETLYAYDPGLGVNRPS